MLKDAQHSAAALYDGGWRSKDKEELQRHYGLTDEETAALVEELKEMEFKHRIREIRHYHYCFRGFPPGDDDGAATYGVIMRSLVHGLLQVLDDAEPEADA
jgi:hypothetical protein